MDLTAGCSASQRENGFHYRKRRGWHQITADALLTAALGGMGVVLFPDWMVNEAMGAGMLIQLMPHYSAAIGSSPSPVSAIYPHARHPSLNVRAVIELFYRRFWYAFILAALSHFTH